MITTKLLQSKLKSTLSSVKGIKMHFYTSVLIFFVILTFPMEAFAQADEPDTTGAVVPSWEELLLDAEESDLTEFEETEADTTFEGNIQVIARNYGDSVVLRWAIDQPGLWFENNPYGVGIKRIAFSEDLAYDPENAINLNEEPIKPWPEELWKNYFEQGGDSDLMAVAAQMILGDYSAESRATLMGLSEEMINRHGFAMLAADWEPLAADAMGLRWVDRDIEPGMVYAYEVYCIGDTLLVMPCNQGFVIVNTNEQEPEYIPSIDTIEGRDKQAVLHWNTMNSLHNMSGFLLERSEDGGRTFYPLNEVPFANVLDKAESQLALRHYSYQDSLPVNGKVYWYRISGIDPFGERTIWSELYQVEGVEPMPISVPEGSVQETGDRDVLIKWEVDSQENIFGFAVAWSNVNEGPYEWLVEELLTPESREFIHDSPNLLSMNYYMVYAFKENGDYESSFPLAINIIDTFPPATPLGLEGFVDTSGVVHVSWDLGPEEDLFGYHVYINNQVEEVPSRVTDHLLLDTAYQHKVSLLTFNTMVVVRVSAMDMSSNASELSEPLILFRPDTLPPVPPVINGFEVTDDGNRIDWITSTSLDIDHHIIYRKLTSEEDWVEVEKYQPETIVVAWMDTQAEHNYQYDYKIVAVDESGLISEPTTLSGIRAFITTPMSSVENLSIEGLDDRRGIVLSWTWPHEAEVHSYSVYRQVDQSNFRLIKRISGEATTYTDQLFPMGKILRYQIQVDLKNKRPVEESEIIDLVFEEGAQD
jgi:uncharacterized protein